MRMLSFFEVLNPAINRLHKPEPCTNTTAGIFEEQLSGNDKIPFKGYFVSLPLLVNISAYATDPDGDA